MSCFYFWPRLINLFSTGNHVILILFIKNYCKRFGKINRMATFNSCFFDQPAFELSFYLSIKFTKLILIIDKACHLNDYTISMKAYEVSMYTFLLLMMNSAQSSILPVSAYEINLKMYILSKHDSITKVYSYSLLLRHNDLYEQYM